MDADGQSRTWRIGELAAAAHVSVRTLRHYDAIGLLRPAARTDAGYRIYAEGDLRRLYRILGLRSLGVPLPEIGGLLDACAGDGAPGIDDLTETMEAMAMTDRYSTSEQQDRLAR